jgi:hypothetical protein
VAHWTSLLKQVSNQVYLYPLMRLLHPGLEIAMSAPYPKAGVALQI